MKESYDAQVDLVQTAMDQPEGCPKEVVVLWLGCLGKGVIWELMPRACDNGPPRQPVAGLLAVRSDHQYGLIVNPGTSEHAICPPRGGLRRIMAQNCLPNHANLRLQREG
jgi:hypothetical protein